MENLVIGRIVHYVMPGGQQRPAMIVHVHEGSAAVNLQVFTDGSNDVYPTGPHESNALNAAIQTGIVWRTSVPFDPDGGVATWHWPERNTK